MKRQHLVVLIALALAAGSLAGCSGWQAMDGGSSGGHTQRHH